MWCIDMNQVQPTHAPEIRFPDVVKQKKGGGGVPQPERVMGIQRKHTRGGVGSFLILGILKAVNALLWVLAYNWAAIGR